MNQRRFSCWAAAILLFILSSCSSLALAPHKGAASTSPVQPANIPMSSLPHQALVPGTLEAVSPPITQTSEFAPGELIVKLKPSAKLAESRLADKAYLSSRPAFKGVAQEHRIKRASRVFRDTDIGKLKKRFAQRAKRAGKGLITPDLSTIYKLALDDPKAPILEICERLRQEPDVEFAEPNGIAKIQMVPNDPYYSSSGSWGQAYDDLWGIKKINCEPAWDVSLGDGVVVAVIDTGLDYNHEDISSNVWANSAEDINHNGRFDNWPSTEQQGGIYGDLDGLDNDGNGKVDDVIGWDFCTYGGNIPDNNPIDDNGHGTHTSGTIAAVGNNGVGVIGVAPHAKIMPVKGLNSQGYGYTDDLAACLTYAADNGADVLNNSWAYFADSNTIRLAVEYADSLGCLVVAAAGNYSVDIGPTTFVSMPATVPCVMTVAATDTTDQRASFSNYGAYVDVAAPGVDVLSLRAANTDLYLGSSGYSPGRNFVPAYDPNARYYRANGTSMACPHVSGVAALILGAHPTWSKTQVERILENSAEVPAAWDKYLGAGRANAGSALQTSSVTEALVEITYPTENVYLFEGTEITGTATGDSYVVELGQGLYPSSWTQIGSGGPMTDGVLATFHGAGVADGFYTLRLRSEDAIETVRCYYDALLRRGFPRRAVHTSASSIVIADLENDGVEEIVSASGLGIDVIGSDGTEADGYPIHTTSGYGNHWLTVNVSPAVGDIVGSNEKEIVILGYEFDDYSGHTHMQTQAFSEGNMLWRFDAVDEWSSYGIPPLLVDRDVDGKNEIVVMSYGVQGTAKQDQHFVYMLSGSGTMIWRTVLVIPRGDLSDGALGDINGDGAEEIVLAATQDLDGDGWSDSSKLTVLDVNGSVLFETAPSDPGIASGALALADVNGDGTVEILYAPWTYPPGGRVYAFNGQGVQLWASEQLEGPIFSISPGDLNSDSLPELVVRCYDGTDSESYNKLYMLSNSGAMITHWTDSRRGWVSLSDPPVAAVADMDADGTPDIIGNGAAWNAAGDPLASSPRLIYGSSWAGNAAVASLSGTGQVDLCGSSNVWEINPSNVTYVFAWELGVPLDRRTFEWPMSAHDSRNSRCYVSPSAKVAMPGFSPDAGTYASLQTVTITCATPGVRICYTTDGSDPDVGDPIIVSGSSVLVDRSLTLRARAYKPGWGPSDVKTAVYTITGTVAMPDFSPDGGSYSSPQSVTITCATEGASIHYTTNGDEPDDTDPVVTGPVLVDHTLTVKARAYKDGLTPSLVKSADYTIRTPIKVKHDAPGPTHDGQTWETAFLTVQEGLNAASSGDEVWVAAGTYVGCITLRDGAALYGGFIGNETLRDQRNWTTNVAVLDGSQAGSVVTVPAGDSDSTVIDGFTIRNGSGTLSGSQRYGGGIYSSDASPTIANNVVTGNGSSYCGGGIYCRRGSPCIRNNTVRANDASMGAGIYCADSFADIRDNVIYDNNGGGMYCSKGAAPAISGNIIRGNRSSGSGGGIHVDCDATIANNTIVGNTDNYAGGIYCVSSKATIANNIIAFGSSGIYAYSSSPRLYNNCFFGNASYDYRGAAPGAGDISLDPQFVNRAAGDLHLLSTSPCIDAGDDIWVQPEWLDMDGQPRIQGAHVEIGADEVSQVATPTFSPDGGTYDAPQSVTIGCATDGAAIHYTANGIDPTEADPVIPSGSSVSVDTGIVLKAKAWKSGLAASAVKSAEYTITGAAGTVATPRLSPDGGAYTRPQSVTISCANNGATIRFTTDGTEPTTGSPEYTGPVLVGTSTTLKAKAWKAGWNDSAVRSASYTIVGRAYVNKNAPGPAHDGLSWATAFLTVKEALTFASPGNEIWVAAATYYERIAMKDGVALYGGFSGTETALNQRNWSANVTILDGNNYQGTVVMMPYGATSTTRIDGFTIQRGGSSSYGLVHCEVSSPTLANNMITGSSSSGVYCISSCATIINNTIASNADAGIRCQTPQSVYPDFSPYVSDNTIRGNKGAGISCGGEISPVLSNNAVVGNSGGGISMNAWSSPFIRNNTVVANSGSGNGAGICIYDDTCSPSLVNNLVAFNSSGIYRPLGSYTQVVLRNNCSYGNTGYDYSGWSVDPTTMNNNISADPKLAAWTYGNLHIQPDSPCVDAGQDSVVEEGSLDMDSQARIQGTHVDIGADESDGTTWNVTPKIVRVSTTGNDANDGSTWPLAKRTVQAGINAASVEGGEVWVKAGVYSERVTVPTLTYLYGGFSGGEAAKSERNWVANVTILDASGSGTVVTSAQRGLLLGAIDGFTIRNGKGYYGCGIYCDSSTTVIANNTITDNGGTSYGGVFCYSSPSVITGNKIVQNSTSNNGGGIMCYGSPPSIINNVIAGNTAARGGGIYCNYSSPTISGNTLSGNMATSDGGGIYLVSSSSPSVANNIVSFGSSGVYKDAGSTPTLRNNDVFGNTAYNYSGLSAGTGDISADPLFANRTGGDYHLTGGSLCINAGWNDAPGLPSRDMDGEARVWAGTVDIGAYEFRVPPVRPSASRGVADGLWTASNAAIVTARFEDSFYIEADDRSSGIRVEKTGHSLAAGMRADVTGRVKTSADGERYIDAATAIQNGSGNVDPLALINRGVGGGDWNYNASTGAGQKGVKNAFGLNNIGLLITALGIVTYSETGIFYIDDGSALADDSGHTGVKVLGSVPVPQGIDPVGKHVKVTGISSCFKSGDDLYRQVRAVQVVLVE